MLVNCGGPGGGLSGIFSLTGRPSPGLAQVSVARDLRRASAIGDLLLASGNTPS